MTGLEVFPILFGLPSISNIKTTRPFTEVTVILLSHNELV